ncbi:MAG TPA: branched-chain amino acid ABC transporter permease [Bosea sp. (in: a-proteobacteria)]|jgi:branched-chain amino acid transport system permease protein|uniref:branched-chain amino acid ABC transporter permease n=1 Tax=Bosea sp. (in: a-proteobacteria) TaxID=1871050 RepID=UPI002E14D3CE|nr:branched-chain amino acid ABC transporter permease [Bosea sp. (in: a-proteobacteria)]
MTAILLQLVISGLLLGGIYALVSVGLTLIFGVSRIKNFAHGDLVMVGMYVTYALTVATGLDPYLLAPVVVLLLFGFGLFLSFALIRPIQGAPQVAQIFATVGLGLVLQNLALMMYGADFRSTPSIISGKVLRFAGVALPASLLIAFVVAMVVIAGLTIFLRLSLTGKAMRAIAQDRRAASLMSIDVKRIDMLTFGLGTACAGLAGALLAPVFPAFPTVGVNLVLICFVVVILGGLGSVEGALIGGLLIGLVETLSGFFLGSAMSQIAYFLVFIAVLCLRPAGLFGQRGAETLGS